MGSTRESGQAAVETALTMPLTLFMVLGTMQLFMLLQGRIFAEHAAYSAVRVGSVRHGDCDAMTQASILALLPSFTSYLGEGTPGSGPAEKLGNAFQARTRNKPDHNRYDAALDDPHDGAIVWLYRESPAMRDVRPGSEDDFDDPDSDGYTLEVRVVYWYPLRIPFANWVMATMYRAYFGAGDYTDTNPLMPSQRARWTQAGARSLGGFRAEFMRRFNDRQYVFPVVGTAAMRMMTPPRRANFRRQHCEPTP
ncbi:MAG: TadE family protein [Archangium sp.]